MRDESARRQGTEGLRSQGTDDRNKGSEKKQKGRRQASVEKD